MSAFPTDRSAFWWILERAGGPDSAFGPFDSADAAETFGAQDPIADDQAAADSLGDRVAEASIDALAAEGVTDVWIVGADMADVDRRERLIAAGRLSPGARSMSLADAIDQHNAANCLDPSDSDYIPQSAGVAVTLVDAAATAQKPDNPAKSRGGGSLGGPGGITGGPKIEVPPVPQPPDLRKQVPRGDGGDGGPF